MFFKVLKRLSPSYFFLLSSLFLLLSLPVCANEAPTLTDVQGSFMQKDYAKTKETADILAAQTKDPQKRSEALYYAGLSDLWLGKYTPARQTIKQVLDSKPSKELRDKASLALIDTYYMEGDYKKSLKIAKDLSYSPKNL